MQGQFEDEDRAVAERWCLSKGEGWEVIELAGSGGTATVFSLKSPDGPRTIKVLSEKFSNGEFAEVSRKRVNQQVELGVHNSPNLVNIFDGGYFENRLFIVMEKAQGKELEKCLKDVPRSQIRSIVDQIAKATIYLREQGLCHRDIKSANIFVSEDYSRATLLDLSVTREIDDPVGIGTDHGGELPVVATSRYTPPEYLFRLIEPCAELWHALDIYQIGGLLHDLIMQEPMFENQYSVTKENRYRFAWVVATQHPIIESDDVDQDLIYLCRRALDKDWKRRSSLRIEDFFDDRLVLETRALGLLGIGMKPTKLRASAEELDTRGQARACANKIKDDVVTYLRRNGVTPTHKCEVADSDNSFRIHLSWSHSGGGIEQENQNADLEYFLTCVLSDGAVIYSLCGNLMVSVNNRKRQSSVHLPDVRKSDGGVEEVSSLAISALRTLALECFGGSSPEEVA